jgi:HAD superfamily hydrolase (TIGR01509 family)
MITTVLFDLGNVLLLFDPEQIVRNFSAAVGVEPEEIHELALAHIKTDFELGLLSPDQFRESICQALNCVLDEEEFIRLWSDIFSLNKPMVEFFRRARQTHRTYLLSNANLYHIRWILERWPELADCDGMALSYELHVLKPDPEFYEAAIDLFELTPSQCVYIDDTPANSRAGREAGFHTVLYENPKQTLAKVDALLGA